MTLHIVKVEWHGEKVSADVEKAAERAEQEAARLLLGKANERVPRRSGVLEASGRVGTSTEGATVSYGTKYAPILRKHPEWNYQDGRSGLWFDEAIDETQDDAQQIYAKEVGGVIGG